MKRGTVDRLKARLLNIDTLAERIRDEGVPGSIQYVLALDILKTSLEVRALLLKDPGKGPTIKVRVEQRPHTPMGVPDGQTSWQVWVVDSGGHPFSGCPLGRSTGGERPAIRDLIRPGYSLPMDTDVTLDDVEVVERRRLTPEGWETL